jgi:hypothetical protein
MKKLKRGKKKVTSLKQKIDGSKLDVIQSGFVDGEEPKKKEPLPTENLTEQELGEKLAYQRILKQLVPSFKLEKLERQRLADLKRFFEEQVNPIIQETILRRYKDISP